MKKIGIVFLCVSLVWTAFVFSRSSKTAVESSEESGSVMDILYEVWDTFGMGEPPSEHVVRKAGHFTEYALLGLFAALSAWGFGIRFWQFWGFGYAVSVAFADEFVVQRLTEGRSPQFTDVLIDAAGAAAAILCLFACISLILLKKSSKSLDK